MTNLSKFYNPLTAKFQKVYSSVLKSGPLRVSSNGKCNILVANNADFRRDSVLRSAWPESALFAKKKLIACGSERVKQTVLLVFSEQTILEHCISGERKPSRVH